MPTAVFLSMLSYMCISSFTPGPANILTLGSTTKYGWRKTIPQSLGLFVGYYIIMLISLTAVLGLSSFMEEALVVLKYIGMAYLIWLGVMMIKSTPKTAEDKGRPTFVKGFLLQMVNAKIFLYCITVISVYFTEYIEGVFNLLLAGTGMALFGIIANTSWGFLGLLMQKVYVKHYKVVNLILGISLFYCALSIFWG